MNMAFSKRETVLTSVQYVLTLLTLIFAIAVLACTVDALKTFTQAENMDTWWWPIFGNLLDTASLQIAITVSSIVLACAILMGVAQLFAAAQRVKPERTQVWDCAERVTLFTIPSILALMTFVDLVYVSYRGRSKERVSIQGWTCTWKPQGDIKTAGIPDTFSRMCRETTFSYWAMLPIFLFQLVLIAVVFFNRRKASRASVMTVQQVVNTSRGIAKSTVILRDSAAVDANVADDASLDNVSVFDDEKEPGASWPL